MRIAIYAGNTQKKEVLSKGINEGVEVIWLNEWQEDIYADAYFNLLFDETETDKKNLIHLAPVFVNDLITTSSELPPNYIRINAWNGFLTREFIELATSNEDTWKKTELILNTLGWKFIWAPDVPGMIAARVISMVINEAYFALGDKISTKEEIDIAMKLGTNYPYGPFEWSEKIGLQKIYPLLKKLNEKERRYAIAPLLVEEVRSKMLNVK